MSAWLNRAALVLLLVGCWSSGAWAAAIDLTAEEQDWIKAHPHLRVGVVEDLIPFEYMDGTQLHGRTLHFLELVSRKTGLSFSYVPGSTAAVRVNMLLEGRVDLLSSYLRFRGSPLPSTLKALPYQSTSPIIVTRVDGPEAFDLEQLQGKTVVIPNIDHYELMFRNRKLETRLIKSNSALEMLNLVKDGRADAVVASETFLMPYLYRQFQGILETSGVVGSQQLDVSMAVRADQAVLFSILDKALNSITPQQRHDLYEQWYRELDVDQLSLLSISSHYLHLLLLGALMLIALGVLVYRSLLQRRRAVRNEQEKTSFLAAMSHEIRSPMNAVLAAMELLGHTRLNDQQRHFADLANSGANALLRLLDNVLDVSKLETGQLRLAVEPTDVGALLQGVVGLQSLRAREKQLALNPHIETQLPLLLLDSTRLAQVFHNVLSNAIKFTDAGYVDINLRLRVEGAAEPQLQIEVRDTGIGISDAVQASLFRPYAQASHSYKRSGGTGLGLVICQQLVGLMNGSLTLRSEQGVGTTVTILLPVTPAPKPLSSTCIETLPPVPALCGLQVLVVEDTLANQEVLRAQISGFGCRPVVAADAAQARALFRESCYDLILMDCDLPDQDGYSLVRELRELEAQLGRLHCPIIAISALTGDQHLERCFAAGMDGVLSKPIGLGKLREVIEAWCDVTLAAPSAALMAPTLDQAAINREMARDVGSLVKAMALFDRKAALHAAHRLHGAALIMEWAALARDSETLENLLRADVQWNEPAYALALKGLVEHWNALSGGMPLDVLPGAPAQWVTPL
ncbi:ATP-binding protein [Pseudomonas putida]|uniref:ATP-binding protein n=1 Tax=Pseudomonas putida TaxID=303 RepID=UPI0023664952|nr:ATP-binding protein [Pseudomonas putida]MDD2047803.1 ATP-binding protein [Pseudomonas putida]